MANVPPEILIKVMESLSMGDSMTFASVVGKRYWDARTIFIINFLDRIAEKSISK